MVKPKYDPCKNILLQAIGETEDKMLGILALPSVPFLHKCLLCYIIIIRVVSLRNGPLPHSLEKEVF